MKKRIISLMLLIVMTVTLLPIMPASAATSISIGDYVTMGTYYGKPIIWRCVDIDENGPLMLSDKIICIKPFDAETSANSTTGSHSRNSYRASWGSNYWADSNMRSWLNSNASAGNVEWLCGNPPSKDYVYDGYNAYDKEAGFLTNFTNTEKSAIKTVTQKSIVAYPEIDNGIYTEGSERFSFNYSISSVVRNYDSAYAERVTDTVFLLDVKQVNKVYQNSNILGEDYYIGEPTQEAVDNSEYKSSSLSTGKKWYYWLRSPHADHSYNVRLVNSDGYVGYYCAYYDDYGVRPAFYLNQLSVIYKSGNGSQSNPFVIDGNSKGESGLQNSISSATSNEVNITVYKNKNNSSSMDGKYVLCPNAKINVKGTIYTTNSNGKASVPSGTEITVSANGCIDKTVTAEQLKLSSDIYLEKDEGDAPIINSVILGNVDILTHEYEIDITSEESVTLNANIVWKSGSYSKVYLQQNGTTVQFSGNTLNTVLSKSFDVSNTIYIVAVDSGGNSVKKKLKLKAGGSVPDVLDGFKFSMNDKMSFTMPNDFPFIGGSSIKIGMDSKVTDIIPISISTENNKVYISIGIDIAEYKKSDKYITSTSSGYRGHKLDNETKTAYSKIKDIFDTEKSGSKNDIISGATKLKNLKNTYGQAMKYPKGSMAFNADFTLLGFGEGYINSKGEFEWLDGGIILNPSVGANFSGQFALGPVPCYWEAQIAAEIKAQMNLYINATAKNFLPNGLLEGTLKLGGGAGVGLNKIASIGGGIEGSLKPHWEIKLNAKDYFRLKAGLSAYFKATLCGFEYKKPWDIAEATWIEYPKTTLSAYLASEEFGDIYDVDKYEIVDRSYLENPTDFVINDFVSLADVAPENKTEKTFVTNSYTYSEPKIVEFSNGDMLAVWLNDDSSRSDINRTALSYSYYTYGMWSEPEIIENDGTADFSPSVKVAGDKAYIAWIDTKSVLDEETIGDVSDVASEWDISAAIFDNTEKSFGKVENISNNSSLDIMPAVFGDEDNIALIWVSNSSNNIFGTENDNSVMISRFSENSWSNAEVYADNLYSVDSLDGGIVDGNEYISYSVDMDGNLEDASDKEIYVNNERITNNETLDSNPVFDGEFVYWYSVENVVEYNVVTKEYNTVLSDEITNDRFDVISDAKGNKAIVFSDADGLISEICTYIYDDEASTWSKKIMLTDFNSDMNDFCGVFKQNGDMQFIINKTAITGAITDENPYGQTDISLFTVSPSYNLTVNDAYYNSETLLAGNTLEIKTEIKNNGELTADNYRVDILNSDEKVIGTTYSKADDAILPGETKEFTVYYPLGDETFVPHNISLRLSINNGEDYDESDNSFELLLNLNDIAVEDTTYGLNEDGNAVIYGNVVNRGYGAGDAIAIELHKDTLDGDVVETKNIQSELKTLDSYGFEFVVPYEQGAIYYVTIASDDMISSNNSDYVMLNSETPTETPTEEPTETPSPIVDKSSLINAIANAKTINSNKYTENSYSALSAALTTAEEVLSDDSATAEQVENARLAIEVAISGLVEKSEQTKPTETPIETPTEQPTETPTEEPKGEKVDVIGDYSEEINLYYNNSANLVTFTVEPIDADISKYSDIKLFIAGYNSLYGPLKDISVGVANIADGKLIIKATVPNTSIYKIMLWDKNLVPLIKIIEK